MAPMVSMAHAPIRINAAGVWLHGEVPIASRIAELFARSLVVEGDGAYAIALAGAQERVEVADAPLTVRLLLPNADQDGWVAHTSDGRSQPLDPATLMQSPEHVLYARVVRGDHAVPCRLTQQQYHELALGGAMAGDALVVTAGRRRYVVGPYDPRPQPISRAAGETPYVGEAAPISGPSR